MRALLAEDAKEDELSRRDAALEALGLCSNEELVEGAPLSSGEAEILEYVRSKVPPTDMAELDEYWVLRLVRGGQTTPQRFEEAVATFGRVARWRRELSKHRLDDEFEARMREFATRCVRSVVGGEDLYGHVVWVEQLLDVQMMTEGPRGEMLLARGRLTEGIERFKRAVASRLGVMRYKQIYVLDLAPLSVGPLLGSSDVRAAVEDLISFGSKYYPEGTFRIFIVNAPLVFRSAYAILSPLINPTTREKIRILGPNFLDVMRASGIPTESVPELVGGQHPGREVLDLVLTPKNNPPRGGSFSEMLEDERVSLFTPPPPDEDPRATLFHPPPPDDDLSPVSSCRTQSSGFFTSFSLFSTCARSNQTAVQRWRPRRRGNDHNRHHRRRRPHSSISSSSSCFGSGPNSDWFATSDPTASIPTRVASLPSASTSSGQQPSSLMAKSPSLALLWDTHTTGRKWL